MKVTFIFQKSSFDCDALLRDGGGTRRLPAPCGDASVEERRLAVEIVGDSCELTLTPKLAATDDPLGVGVGSGGILGGLERGLGKLMSKAEASAVLLVSCRYCVQGLTDGDTVTVVPQRYEHDTSFGAQYLFDLLPTEYFFYEAYHQRTRLEPRGAFGTNRKAVIKTMRPFAMVGPDGILTYPICMVRIRYLTRDRKVMRTLIKFHRMSDAERAALYNSWRTT